MEEQEVDIDKLYEDFIYFMESRQTDVEHPIATLYDQKESLTRGPLSIDVNVTYFDNKLTYLYHYWKSNYATSDMHDLKESVIDLTSALDFSIHGKLLHVEFHTSLVSQPSILDQRRLLVDILELYDNKISELEGVVKEDTEILLLAKPHFKEDFKLCKKFGFTRLFENVFVKRLKYALTT